MASEHMDPFQLSNSDHPGMSLTNSKFAGVNFIGWSRTIRMALGAKQKLGFIDGTIRKPDENSTDLQKWIRCDYMVTCWVLNSMEPEFSDAFIYAQSSNELWREINERFGHISGPQVYHIQKELNELTQGNLTIASFFTKLKRFWDELQMLNSVPVCSCGKMLECSCGIQAKYEAIENRNKLVQFLMKLNPEYDTARSQILSMDPLPSVNKAYYLIQQIESQKNTTRTVPEPAAFFVNNNSRPKFMDKRDNRRGRNFEKRYCKHCKSEGHSFEQCWERIGYPDWHKSKRDKKYNRFAANVETNRGFEQQDNPLEECASQSFSEKKELDPDLVSAVCNQMMRMFQEKNLTTEASIPMSTNFAGPYQ